jgi:hypothetical protein
MHTWHTCYNRVLLALPRWDRSPQVTAVCLAAFYTRSLSYVASTRRSEKDAVSLRILRRSGGHDAYCCRDSVFTRQLRKRVDEPPAEVTLRGIPAPYCAAFIRQVGRRRFPASRLFTWWVTRVYVSPLTIASSASKWQGLSGSAEELGALLLWILLNHNGKKEIY